MSRFVSTAVVLVALTAAVPAVAGPYSPDPAFGDHGVVLGPADLWNDVVAMPDGRVLVGGEIGDALEAPPRRMALGRFLSDGSPDPTFGGGDGYVETVVGIASGITALALQADGKIVAVGWAQDADEDVVVLRYLSNGTLDPDFGTGGITSVDLDDSQVATDVVIRPDGKILVVGSVIARFLDDGTLDATFDGDGIMTSVNGAGVALQPDGRFLVVGTQGSPNTRVALWRILADGGLDPSFGTGGVVLTDVTPGFDLGRAVALLPDGRIYAAGFVYANDPSAAWLLMRYLDTGALDVGFGSGGIVTTPVGTNALLGDMAVQADGRIVLAGQWYEPTVGFELAVIRYLTDGSIDPSFGMALTYVGPPQFYSEAFNGVEIAADGDIVAAGFTRASMPADSIIVRYGTAFPVCWDGVIDAPEQCDDRNYLDGDCCSSTCQLDAPGVACAADADPCTADVCNGAGLCTHGPGNDGAPCDDADACTTDACQGGACVGVAEPSPVCKEPVPPARGLFFVSGARDKLSWNWFRGEATSQFLRQQYALCVYDQSGALQPVTKLENICASALCGWTQKGSQPIFVDDEGSYDGITRMYFTPGVDGKARIQFRARGANLPSSPLPFVTPVTVQLHGLSDGQCWSATYSTSRRNDSETFRAKPD